MDYPCSDAVWCLLSRYRRSPVISRPPQSGWQALRRGPGGGTLHPRPPFWHGLGERGNPAWGPHANPSLASRGQSFDPSQTARETPLLLGSLGGLAAFHLKDCFEAYFHCSPSPCRFFFKAKFRLRGPGLDNACSDAAWGTPAWRCVESIIRALPSNQKGSQAGWVPGPVPLGLRPSFLCSIQPGLGPAGGIAVQEINADRIQGSIQYTSFKIFSSCLTAPSYKPSS